MGMVSPFFPSENRAWGALLVTTSPQAHFYLCAEGFGHEYFSAEKFLDPASPPTRLRLSHPPVATMMLHSNSSQLFSRIIVRREGFEPS